MCQSKNFENWSIFDEVVTKHDGLLFGHPILTSLSFLSLNKQHDCVLTPVTMSQRCGHDAENSVCSILLCDTLVVFIDSRIVTVYGKMIKLGQMVAAGSVLVAAYKPKVSCYT